MEQPSLKNLETSFLASPLALAKELFKVSRLLTNYSTVYLPKHSFKKLGQSIGSQNQFNPSSLWTIVGDSLLDLLNELGPVYGKIAQTALSRQTNKSQKILAKANIGRVYGDWPALPFEEIEEILNQEIPGWRGNLRIDPIPLGVASIGQVHSAKDHQGNKWVVKIVKPEAEARLKEATDALLQLTSWLKPLALTHASKRQLAELQSFCRELAGEVDLSREAATIEKLLNKTKDRKNTIIRIPKLHPDFQSSKVLVCERFIGIALSDLVSKPELISESLRRKLASRLLSEMLVQIFELGLFHADPHAGNLILLPDESLGLFDWGLAGQMDEHSRKHIAAILKAVVRKDLDLLANALVSMGAASGRKDLSKERVLKELQKLAKTFQNSKTETKKAKKNLPAILNECLGACDRLDLPVPQNLLLLAKSLLTIEGLAKGLDPEISLGKAAFPYLFKAMKPGFGDLFAMGKNIGFFARAFKKDQ